MDDEKQKILTETSKIRFHLMDLIRRNSNQSIRILSTRTLAERFAVARGTVRAAVEKMVQEKYLITKRGIGTFTNPSQLLNQLQSMPTKLVGIKYMGGDQFFYDPPALRTLASLMEELAHQNFIARILTTAATTSAECACELEHSYADGILACEASPEFLRAASQKCPCVAVDLSGSSHPQDIVPTIHCNWHSAVKQMADLLSGGQLYICSEVSCPNGFTRALSATGGTVKRGAFEEFSRLKALPAGVLLPPKHLAAFHRILSARNTGFTICRPFLISQSCDSLPHWLFDAPRRRVFRRAAGILAQMFNGGIAPPPSETMDYELIFNGQTHPQEEWNYGK